MTQDVLNIRAKTVSETAHIIGISKDKIKSFTEGGFIKLVLNGTGFNEAESILYKGAQKKLKKTASENGYSKNDIDNYLRIVKFAMHMKVTFKIKEGKLKVGEITLDDYLS